MVTGPFACPSCSLTAGQLLAERLQRLVGGERTGNLVATGAAARRLLGRVRRRLAGLDLGPGCLGLLLDVGLPASVRLGVLLLPGRALLLEPFEPLAGLRV